MVVIRPERKFYDLQALGEVEVPAGGSTYSLNAAIETGPGANQVVGTHMTIKEIEIIVFYYLHNSTDTFANKNNLIDHNFVAFDLILDKQCNGVAATQSDVWTVPAMAVADPVQMPRVENEERFKFLKSKLVGQSNPGVASSSTQLYMNRGDARVLHWKMKCNIRIDVMAPGGDIARIRSNNIILFVRVSHGLFCTIESMSSRIRFIDV